MRIPPPLPFLILFRRSTTAKRIEKQVAALAELSWCRWWL
jgi:hypothetical protein